MNNLTHLNKMVSGILKSISFESLEAREILKDKDDTCYNVFSGVYNSVEYLEDQVNDLKKKLEAYFESIGK